MRLVLFDIDGTLIMTDGAGKRAMSSALQKTYNLKDGLKNIRLDGKTDPQIVREALHQCGKESLLNNQSLHDFFDAYIPLLKTEIKQSSTYQILPGVPELLDKLSTQDDIVLGLATGNIERGAQTKLHRGNLTSFFTLGGYGSDSENRTEFIRIAIKRALKDVAPPSEFIETFVVGDTPRDIIHAQRAGTRTLAVATGRYSVKSLLSYTPDFAIPNLSNTSKIVDILTGQII